MSEITKADIISKVRELAAANPDYIYYSEQGFCKNYHVDGEGKPIEGSGCIIGRALHEAGFSYAEIPQAGGSIKTLRMLGMPYDGSMEDSWLAAVQEYQDNGSRWESAVEIADSQHPVMET